MNNNISIHKSIFNIIIFFTVATGMLHAQNRGNNLAFQGFGNFGDISTRAMAMGGAFTSLGGDIDALFYNSAGLASISKLKISIGGGLVSRTWTENQIYNPNRLFFTLPFYLEGLYIPDPANNGKLDHEVFYDGLLDTAYVVALPDTGLEPFSDDAADWKNIEKASSPTNFTIAFPFQVAGKNVVAAASWNKNLDFYDYDRNDTYLDPHFGYTEYGMPEVVEGIDTVTINWSKFERSRSGSLQEFRGALAVDVSKNVKTGFSLNYFTGKTDDKQSLKKVGYFNLIDQNEFTFSYDTLDMLTSGTSIFKGMKGELGIQFVFDSFNFGLNLKLPYMVTRDFDYTVTTIDTMNIITTNNKGKEEFKVPAGYTIGVNFRPIEKFIFSLDYDMNRYSKAKWDIANVDTTYRDWVDQSILRFGFQYTPFEIIALRAGYRTVPQVFVPDGAAFRDRGPVARAWTLGIGLNFGKLGSIDAAWEYRILKYYDQYFSNTNYCKEITQNMLIAYQYNF